MKTGMVFSAVLGGGEMNRQGKRRFLILTGGLLAAVVIGLSSPAAGNRSPKEPAETPAETIGQTEASPTDLAREQLYEPLWSFLERNDLAGAASFMSKHAEEIKTLLEDTLQGERRLYNEEGLSVDIEGRGLVLTGAATLFYGNFRGGVPAGNVLALQEITLEQPRYDYAMGSWENGKMNGSGITGYTYYEDTQSADGLKTEKAGVFVNDLMEGAVRYTSIDGNGNSLTWLIQAEKGNTVLDERWVHEKSKGEYYLLSENDDSHAYSVKESELTMQLWRNRLEW